MLLWEDVESARREADKALNDPENVECPKCGSTFLEVIECKQYRKDMPVGLQQRPPSHPKSPSFYFYRCVCGEVLEPPITASDNDLTRKYIKFVESVKKALG